MRPPLALLALLLVAAPVRADESVYALPTINDPESHALAQLRRLLSPLELAMLPNRETWPLMADPSKQASYEAAKAAATAALTGPNPDFAVAVPHVERMRAEVFAPTVRAYLQSSAAAARSGGPLTPLETRILSSYILFWNPDVPASGASAPMTTPYNGRALLRATAQRYVDAPPSGRIDFAAMRAVAQTDVRGALAADATVLTRLRAAAGMTAPAAATASVEGPAAVALRGAMPDPAFTALERTILSTVLTPAALAEVTAGSWAADRLHREALDAANLAVADQNHDEIKRAVAAKTIYRAGALPALLTSVPRADMSRYVCANMAAVSAAAPAGDGDGAAMAQLRTGAHRGHGALSAASDEGASTGAEVEDVIQVGPAVALPGVSDYCRDTASLRTSPASSGAALLTPPQPAHAGNGVPALTGTAGAPGGGNGSGSGSGGPSILGGVLGGAGGLGLALALGAGGPAVALFILAGVFAGFAISSLFGKK